MAENATPSLLIRLRFFAQLNNNTPPSASTFNFLAAFSSSISRHFLSLKHRFSHSSRLQFTAAFIQLTISTIAVFLVFLQLKYPNSSPFSTHPTAMSVAVSCFAVCFLASAAALRFHDHHPLALLALHLSLSSAYTLIASVVSVLLPDSGSSYVYAVSGLISAAELLSFLLCYFDFENGRRWCFRRFFNNICRNSSHRRLPI